MKRRKFGVRRANRQAAQSDGTSDCARDNVHQPCHVSIYLRQRAPSLLDALFFLWVFFIGGITFRLLLFLLLLLSTCGELGSLRNRAYPIMPSVVVALGALKYLGARPRSDGTYTRYGSGRTTATLAEW
jgi:hypothetical protein